MGTKVQCKSYLPEYYSMRDLNEDSNSCSWPLYYGDKTYTSGQYYNGFLPRISHAYPGYDKDSVKQTMLEHEAIFKKQVHELHRLYRIQRDMMDEVRRKELHRNIMQVETSLSSSPLASQITSVDARKWNNHGFPMVNSICARPSVSGLEGIHSPMSSMKGNGVRAGPCPSQNGCSSKDIKVLESRPTKVRRKTFDLQLPADEYIDTEEGEQLSGEKLSAVPENGVKFFLDDGRKTDDCKGGSQKSDRCLRSPNGLADLNEPVQLEDVKETNASSHDYCNGKIQDFDRSGKPNSRLLGLPKETSLNSYGSGSGTQINLHLHKNGNGRGWFSHAIEVGQRSQSMRVSSNKVHEPSFYLSDKSKPDLWKEKKVFGVEISERTPALNDNKSCALLATSHVTSLYQISPLDLGNPWSHSWEKQSSSFSQKPILAQTYGGSHAATLNKSSQSSVQTDGICGDMWCLSSNVRSNPAEFPYRNGFYQGSSSGSKEQPICIPSSCGDYDRAPGHNDGLEKYYKGSNCVDTKPDKGMNLNVVISGVSSNQEMTLRGVETLGTEQKREDHLTVLPWLRAKPACKNEVAESGPLSKTGKTSFFQSSLNQSPSKNEIAKGYDQLLAESVKSFSSAGDVQDRKPEPTDCSSNKKLLGFPIFEKPCNSKNEASSLTLLSSASLQPSENVVVNKLNRMLDINLPCDPAVPDLFQQNEAEIVVVEKVKEAKLVSFRHHIDLNSCLSDDEAALKPSAPIARVKVIADIDLEVPAVPEAEDDVVHGKESALKQNEAPVMLPKCNKEVQRDERVMVAAEAIMAISASICHKRANGSGSPSEAPSNECSLADPLKWFVEVISSCGDDLEGKLDASLRAKHINYDEEDSSEEFDYFEAMILQLSETKEEDYMPTPLIPENLKLEETGPTLLTSRPRKGQARRGRQRRDFQRDILPGLASLSRHEVTEDLQTFGGLMRATGHSWHSGLTRRSSTRNGSGRGRRRVVVSPTSPPAPTNPPCAALAQQLSSIEMGLDDRSLTGWGKITRRPRRQRCPAGR